MHKRCSKYEAPWTGRSVLVCNRLFYLIFNELFVTVGAVTEFENARKESQEICFN